jgi:hypothetical protein
MNDPENIVAAIYRTVDWTNGESKLALLVAVVEGKYRSTQRFVERALLNRVYREKRIDIYRTNPQSRLS